MLNLDKSSFLQGELEYLGHKIIAESIKPLAQNVEQIIDFLQPINKKELERFLGLAGYYHKFVENL